MRLLEILWEAQKAALPMQATLASLGILAGIALAGVWVLRELFRIEAWHNERMEELNHRRDE